MIQVVPWSSYTWKSHVKSGRDRIERLEKDLASAKLDLRRSEKELVQAEALGIADEPIPDNYGDRLLTKEQIKERDKMKIAVTSSATSNSADFSWAVTSGNGAVWPVSNS